MSRFLSSLLLAATLVPPVASAHVDHDGDGHRCYISAGELAEGAAKLLESGVVRPENLATPARRYQEADPDVRRSGEIVTVELEVCQGGQDPSTCGYSVEGSRDGRNVYDFAYYGVHLMKRLSAEVGDHIHIPVFFTDFQTLEFPGAVYQDTFNDVQGIGMEPFNHRLLFGRDPLRSSFEGMISMNLWWNCTVSDLHRMQPRCSDGPPFDTRYRGLHSILAHELGHRWGATLLYRDPLRSVVTNELLGRSDTHWSFWLNTGGSPLEGNAWVDNGDGSFRVVHGPFARYSDFDLYAMGLMEKEEVEPTFFIRPEGCPGAYHCDRAQGPVRVEDGEFTARGSRVDVSIDDVIAALGPRSPTVEDSPKIKHLAFVMAKQKPSPNSDSFGADEEAVAKLERIRRFFSEYYYEATGTRARVTTTLSGRDDYPRWEFTLGSEGWGAEGARGEPQAVGGMVGVEVAGSGAVALSHSRVQLDAAEYKSAAVKLLVPKSAKNAKVRLAFGGLDGGLAKPLELKAKADGKVHEYVFDLRKAAGWKGTVGQISLGVSGVPKGGAIAVDRVELSEKSRSSKGPVSEDGGGCGATAGAHSLLALLLVGLGARRLRGRAA